jgi:hypothetical protein
MPQQAAGGLVDVHDGGPRDVLPQHDPGQTDARVQPAMAVVRSAAPRTPARRRSPGSGRPGRRGLDPKRRRRRSTRSVCCWRSRPVRSGPRTPCSARSSWPRADEASDSAAAPPPRHRGELPGGPQPVTRCAPLIPPALGRRRSRPRPVVLKERHRCGVADTSAAGSAVLCGWLAPVTPGSPKHANPVLPAAVGIHMSATVARLPCTSPDLESTRGEGYFAP